MREIIGLLKVVGMLLISIVLSCGFWWVFGWFLSGGEVNPLHWWVIGKLVYIFFSGITIGGLLDMFLK